MAPKVVKESLKIGNVSDGRNTAALEVRAPRGSWRPAVGNEIVLTAGISGLREFGGTVDDISETTWPAHQQSQFILRCVGYDQILDRLIVPQAFDNQPLGDIVRSLWETYLDGEGVTLGTIEDGPGLGRIVFPYIPLQAAFQQLMDLTGFNIAIDRYKVLNSQAKGSVLAPFTIDTSTSETAHCQSLTIRRHRDLYRNRQYIRGSKALTDPRSETFIGNGSIATFVLAFPVGAEPTVLKRTTGTLLNIDGVQQIVGFFPPIETPQTVGIAGIDSGKDWYWSKDDTNLSQDENGVALTVVDELVVTYQGRFPVVIQSQLDDEISDRQAVEGGSGLYEDVDNDETLEGQIEIVSKSVALLNRYGLLPVSADIVTTERGLDVGQVIHVIAPEYDIDAEFLIQTIDAEYFNGEDLLYTVGALAGENMESWVTFFRKLVSNKPLVLNDGESLLISKQVGPSAAVLAGDSVSVHIGAASGGSFSLSPSSSPSASMSPSGSTSPSQSVSPSGSKSPSSSNSPSDSASPPPLLFGRETFESGASPYTFDSLGQVDVGGPTGVAISVDATSKVNSVHSLRFVTTGEGGAAGVKDLGADYTALNVQCTIFIPTGFTWGVNGFITIVRIDGPSGLDADAVFLNLEDYGVPKLTIQGGGIAYTPVLDLAENTKQKIEVLIVKSTTVGVIQAWVNNDDPESADYDSGLTIPNTGATLMRKVSFGLPYAPEAVSDLWMDDLVIADDFIGSRN